ncbi:MAG: wax ester/triacylglycerol synthase family O-acyltransferase [Burkholderiales bacterium]|nr:wax ester/triacylglycerol synthase family O-acyltransferase [Burkholderiales bacterium]
MTRERMSSVDHAWLRMDSPSNRMMIVGVWIFEAPMTREALAQRLRERFLAFGRFRQRVSTDEQGVWWVDDDSFDLDRHLVAERLADPGSERQLQKRAADLAVRPLAPEHPLWQFHLVEDYRGASALITRIHHCIADGIALVKVMLSMSDDGVAPAPRTRRRAHAGPRAALPPMPPLPPLGDLLSGGSRLVQDALSIALMTEDSRTRLKGPLGRRKALAWNAPLPLTDVKAVCRALGVSVNDVLLSCVAGALRRYLVFRGDDTAGVEIRAMVPVNLRAPDDPPDLGNRFGLVPLVLPVGIANPLARLYEVRRRMGELKGGFQAPLAYLLLAVLGQGPRALQGGVLDYLAGKSTAVMTNVPGPAEPIRILGNTVGRLMFWVPQSGPIGMGVSILSYRGGVQFGVMTDAGLCPQPQRIIDGFAPEFERLLLTLALLPSELLAEGAPDPDELEHRLFGPAAAPAPRARRRRASR